MTASRYWTAQAIMDQVAIEAGLDAPGANVYSSTDKNVILLRNLLNTAGQGLSLQHHWPALIKEQTWTVVNPGDSTNQTLPTDFNGFVDSTGWDRTNDRCLIPVSPDTWQYIKTGAVTSTLRTYFRLKGDVLSVETLPANGTVIVYEYWSRYWVAVTAAPTVVSKATATISTDVVHFEPSMMAALLKLRFLQARGQDTTAALVEFERLFDAATSRTTAARPLEFGRTPQFAWIDASQVPDTGLGP